MPGVRKRGEEIREYLLNTIPCKSNFAELAAERFGITLQAVYKHVDRLVSENKIKKNRGVMF